MKYTVDIEIDRPLQQVIDLFSDPGNLQEWQPGFISIDHLEGEPGKAHSTSRLKYKMGKRDIEMIETIIVNKLPDEFKATYETKGVFNTIVCRFRPLGENKTHYISANEFKFSGMMKFFGWFMPGAFKNQSYQYLEHFKRFAESK